MGYVVSNASAILAATVAGLLAGALFHLAMPRIGPRSPMLFLALTCLAEAWLAAILAGALILAPAAGPGPWVMALASAVVIWIGFVLPTTLVTGLHAGISGSHTLAYALHWLVAMVAQAAALQLVGLVKPT